MLEQEAYPELASQSNGGSRTQHEQTNPMFRHVAALDPETNCSATLFNDIRDGSVQLDEPARAPRILGGVMQPHTHSCSDCAANLLVEEDTGVLHRDTVPILPDHHDLWTLAEWFGCSIVQDACVRKWDLERCELESLWGNLWA